MSFLKFILKNPFRVKSRAALSIVGIAIGIMLIVALGAVSEGLKSSSEDSLRVGGTDFIVFPTKMISKDGTPQTINASYVDDVKNFKGVNDVAVTSMYYVFSGDTFTSLKYVLGLEPDKLNYFKATVTKGRVFKNNKSEVIIGKIYASSNNKSVGDTINLEDTDFKVTGIFETGSPDMDKEIVTSLERAQYLSKSDEVQNIYVKLDKGYDVETVKKDFDKEFKDKNLTAVSSVEDSQTFKQQLNMIDGATWAISLLAIVVGGIGIINTMIMSIFERIREIGVLKSVGWTKRRILLMIMGESIVLTCVSAVVGSIIAILGTQALVLYLGPDGIFTVKYTFGLFFNAFIVALIVGVVGGIYPAYKASKMPPTEALRYE